MPSRSSLTYRAAGADASAAGRAFARGAGGRCPGSLSSPRAPRLSAFPSRPCRGAVGLGSELLATHAARPPLETPSPRGGGLPRPRRAAASGCSTDPCGWGTRDQPPVCLRVGSDPQPRLRAGTGRAETRGTLPPLAGCGAWGAVSSGPGPRPLMAPKGHCASLQVGGTEGRTEEGGHRGCCHLTAPELAALTVNTAGHFSLLSVSAPAGLLCRKYASQVPPAGAELPRRRCHPMLAAIAALQRKALWFGS